MHEAKRYLFQISDARAKRKNLERQIREIETDLISLSGIDYSKPYIRASSSDGAAFEHKVAELNDMKERLAAEIISQRKLEEKIISQINDLGSVYSEILFKRYVSNMQLSDIAEEMNYSYDWMRHMHSDALDEFSRRYLQ